jgi:hypothetical protein
VKLLLLILGFGSVAVAVVLLKPIIKILPDMGFADWFIGSFALSLLLGGLKMIGASFFVR